MERVKHRLIAVNASSPGAGKSTLAAGLLEAGLVARWLTEEDLNAREAFARCGAALCANDPAAVDLAVASARALVLEHGGREEAWLVDSLLPGFMFLVGRYPRARLARYCDELARVLGPLDLLLVYLDGQPDVFLDRAADRGGPAFLDRLVANLGRAMLPAYPGGAIRTAEDLRRFFAWADAETRVLLDVWPGPTLVLDAGGTSVADLRVAAMRGIDRA